MNSPKQNARMAGLLYLLLAVTGAFALMYVPSRIIGGDAAATVNNIIASELLFRMGILSSLICQTLFIFLVLALYHLLKEVNKKHALLMVAVVVASVPIAFLNELNQVAALLLVTEPDFLTTFEAGQRQVMVMLFLQLYAKGIQVVEIFWGLWLIPFGLLVFKSGFIPRILGVLLIIGGIGYMASSFTFFTFPSQGPFLSSIFTVPSAIGELAIVLWLLIKGVKDRPVGIGLVGQATN